MSSRDFFSSNDVVGCWSRFAFVAVRVGEAIVHSFVARDSPNDLQKHMRVPRRDALVSTQSAVRLWGIVNEDANVRRVNPSALLTLHFQAAGFCSIRQIQLPHQKLKGT